MFAPRIRYQPGETVLHRLHPLSKLAWLIGISVGVFVFPRLAVVLVLLVGVSGLYALMRLWPFRALRGTRILLLTSTLLFVLQALFNHQGVILFHLWPSSEGAWPVTDVGLRTGAVLSGRFLVVVLSSYLYVLTTDPSALAFALMRAGVPYRYGFALITALRLAPVFEVEGQTVYQAQLARGVSYDIRSPWRAVLMLRRLFFPLLVSALSKVDALAVSMEGRCFAKYPRRTYVRQHHWRWVDTVALIVLVSVFVGGVFALGMSLNRVVASSP